MTVMHKDRGECTGNKCRDGEECGTLSLGDRPGQLRGWNVPEKYVAYSWRTGNKALSFSLHLSSLPSQSNSFTPNPAACHFTSLSVSSPHSLCLCVFLSLPSSPGLWCYFSPCPSSFSSNQFLFSPFMLRELSQHGGVAPLRLVTAECGPACHLGIEMKRKNNSS